MSLSKLRNVKYIFFAIGLIAFWIGINTISDTSDFFLQASLVLFGLSIVMFAVNFRLSVIRKKLAESRVSRMFFLATLTALFFCIGTFWNHLLTEALRASGGFGMNMDELYLEDKESKIHFSSYTDSIWAEMKIGPGNICELREFEKLRLAGTVLIGKHTGQYDLRKVYGYGRSERIKKSSDMDIDEPWFYFNSINNDMRTFKVKDEWQHFLQRKGVMEISLLTKFDFFKSLPDLPSLYEYVTSSWVSFVMFGGIMFVGCFIASLLPATLLSLLPFWKYLYKKPSENKVE